MRVGLCFDGFYSIQEMIELAQLGRRCRHGLDLDVGSSLFSRFVDDIDGSAGLDQKDQSRGGASESLFAQSD